MTDLRTDQNDFGDQFNKSDLVLVHFFHRPANITLHGNDVVYHLHHFYDPGDDNQVILWRASGATSAVYLYATSVANVYDYVHFYFVLDSTPLKNKHLSLPKSRHSGENGTLG